MGLVVVGGGGIESLMVDGRAVVVVERLWCRWWC